MLYAVLALLAIVTAAVLALPLLRRRAAEAEAGKDLALYRAQLDELEAERAQGAIGAEEAAAARIEVERRLLRAADRPRPAAAAAMSAGGRRAVVAVLALFVAAAGAALYARLGNPDLPDRPAVKEADVPAEEATPDELAVRLAAALRDRPDELRGWLMLGPLANSVARYDLAVEAYQGATRLQPGDVRHWLALGEAYTARDAGMVGPEARAAFAKALILAPGNPMARYFLGLADFQDHNDRAAFDRWSALAKDTPPKAEWAATLARGLDRVARRLGEPEPEFVAALRAAQPGPSAAQMQAAGALSEADRGAMIEGMVQRLADRLKRNPDDLDGWLRLANAYGVLGRTQEAADAYGQVLRLDPANAAARDALAALKAE